MQRNQSSCILVDMLWYQPRKEEARIWYISDETWVRLSQAGHTTLARLDLANHPVQSSIGQNLLLLLFPTYCEVHGRYLV